MRLQVFISHSRVCSRRKALLLVREGHISVNGAIITEPSYAVNPDTEQVYWGKKKIELKKNCYLMLNKPAGYVTTLFDKHAKHTVLDLLPIGYRGLYPVGRLDKDSEGLLLFTNDGDLTNRLLHPKFEVGRVYIVEINDQVSKSHIEALERGIDLDGKLTHPASLSVIYSDIKETTLKIKVHEGRKRQIRLMFLKLGYRVVKLTRIKYGNISLGNLKSGQWRILSEEEVAGLKAQFTPLENGVL